ncbi:DNA-binding transcriptional regulator [Alteromonas sp. 14N.309.X.WAT.G.H12]|uniref:XylR family transcriptional regulator n=1 Tax=Alteromonas sp. 14N.309.X.WAT.G.H12 TaxID=3120824 RepID=UPI002FD41B48
MFHVKHSITLLFNANKIYDRQVIEGIGNYLQASKANWDVYLEEDFLCRLDHIDEWSGDGIIADFDSEAIRIALKHTDKPVIGVGSSYFNEEDYPAVPYIATDNYQVVKYAFEHLKSRGLERFAFYGVPYDASHLWARERATIFAHLVNAEGYPCDTYCGLATSPDTWHHAINQLVDWLQALPKPIGIIAVTDSRARHILQACELANIPVPDKVSVIGIDDDDIARHLSRISLSSVTQGCVEMGYRAAKMLHGRLIKPSSRMTRVLVPPAGIAARQSTDYKALTDPYVIQAMQFIRQNATHGIKVEQVTDFIGISRSNLEQRFLAERGHTVHAEIHNEKLVRAQSLLEETDISSKEIASSCGYPSLQYMYAIFKRHFNLTPTQYRNQHREKDN